MAARKRKISISVEKKGNKLVPVSAYDEEQLDRHKDGTEFRVEAETGRSLPQLRLFWKVLGEIVVATEWWPTADHLKEALLRDLGYTELNRTLQGGSYIRPDSIAISNMDEPTFDLFFDRAMLRIHEGTDIDTGPWLEEAQRIRRERAEQAQRALEAA